jgi:lysine-specific demethylase 3
MLTQIIAGDALEQVADRMRDECRTTLKTPMANGVIKKEEDPNSGTHLRDLIGSENTVKMSDIIDQAVEDSMEDKKSPFKVPLRHFVRRVSEVEKSGKNKNELEDHYTWRHGLAPSVRAYNIGETKPLYQGITHSWLCDGKVLRLEVPAENNSEKKALDLFQEVWRRGQPIVIGSATRKMNLNIWDPSRLSSEFGNVAVELTNIQTGDNLSGNYTLKKFWEGFSNVSKRLRDEDGEPALLKLKDWPSPGNSGEEFSETLPGHSANILAGLPLPAYTDRGLAGMFNLAANLPDVFVRPDLGPRSYISYGDSQSPDCGTYNLHLELADTLWILVRAETPSDLDKPEYKNQVVRTLEFVGCNEAEQRRAADGSESLPGCLWHIFHPSHADGIRDLLNREAAEKRAKAKRMLTKKSRAAAANNSSDDVDDADNEDFDPNFDPIHEEGTYLNGDLLKKLADDYGIVPFVFTLFEGEAVVIPAGAPRQVKLTFHSYEKKISIIICLFF